MTTTLGIDLASQPKNTAVCTIAWGDGAAEVLALAHGGPGAEDAALRQAIRAGHAKVGIDAPLGWPEPFMDALARHRDGRPWPQVDAGALALRETDRFVRERAGKRPLSVSTDRIAYCAFRCARLLDALDEPRDGTGLVVEAYPDAALRCWLPGAFRDARAPTYKGEPGGRRRTALVDEVLRALGGRFSIREQWRADCVDSDDCLDALLCALIARAADRGRTVLPTVKQAPLARLEGWIHLPEPGSLKALVA